MSFDASNHANSKQPSKRPRQPLNNEEPWQSLKRLRLDHGPSTPSPTWPMFGPQLPEHQQQKMPSGEDTCSKEGHLQKHQQQQLPQKQQQHQPQHHQLPQQQHHEEEKQDYSAVNKLLGGLHAERRRRMAEHTPQEKEDMMHLPSDSQLY